jgi:hypothetical protein
VSSKLRFSINFVGVEKPLYLDGDTTILHKLKTEDWVQIGNAHIKTSNITAIIVSEAPEGKSEFFTSGFEEYSPY